MLTGEISPQSEQLRERVAQARSRMALRLGQGAAGDEVAAEFSEFYDGLIADLWRGAVRGAGGARLALVATGGWGRREVCPYSDIDFILLTAARDLDAARRVAEGLLYPLWDAGIDVGHAVREPAATAKLAREDLATATALVDARFVVGEPRLADELIRLTRRVVAPGENANRFIRQLVAENDQRHRRFGDSLYLLEPNLKYGIGALRDVATAFWAARARFGLVDLDELTAMGHLSSRQVTILKRARAFLLKLRSLAQLTAGRRTEQLTFEIQEAIAPGLYPDAELPEGDIRPAVAPAVEALMQHYYLHARGGLGAKERLLEVALVPQRKKPRIARIDRSFVAFNGYLAVRDPDVFRQQPAEMLRIFRVAADQGMPVYGHTKELIAENLAAARDPLEPLAGCPGESPFPLAGDAAAARYFLAALTDPGDRGQPSLLEQMHYLGLLSAVMPEFAPCTCRVQHDLYHVYTVDQHQLYTVAMLKRLARGELANVHPTATAAFATVTRLEPLYLATLLHDVGKPHGKGHADKGARLAVKIATRLEMSEQDVRLTEFLVRQHLTMSHLSQRRDLSDPNVRSRFAQRVGEEETLVQLYLLTLCDTAMTAPGNLSAWKEQLLREMFVCTRDYLRGGSGEAFGPGRAPDQIRRRATELLLRQGETSAEISRILCGMDERFLSSLTPRQLARHAELALAQERNASVVELAVAHYPLKGHSEVAIVAPDVHGVLAAIAGVLAANRVDVLAATVGSRVTDSGARVALDLFFVRDLVGKAIPGDDPRWGRIRSDLERLVAGGRVVSDAIDELLGRRRPKTSLESRIVPEVPTRIEIDNDSSAEATILEVFARDRVGLLYAITHCLAKLGFDICVAKLGTEGVQVTDTFYITEASGAIKVTDEARLKQLRRGLEEALARDA